jgi:hypothetical protein
MSRAPLPASRPGASSATSRAAQAASALPSPTLGLGRRGGGGVGRRRRVGRAAGGARSGRLGVGHAAQQRRRPGRPARPRRSRRPQSPPRPAPGPAAPPPRPPAPAGGPPRPVLPARRPPPAGRACATSGFAGGPDHAAGQRLRATFSAVRRALRASATGSFRCPPTMRRRRQWCRSSVLPIGPPTARRRPRARRGRARPARLRGAGRSVLISVAHAARNAGGHNGWPQAPLRCDASVRDRLPRHRVGLARLLSSVHRRFEAVALASGRLVFYMARRSSTAQGASGSSMSSGSPVSRARP